MVFMRDFVRTSYLKEFFSIDSLKINTEISPIVLFGVTLIIGLYVVYWLIKEAYFAYKVTK